MEVRGGTLGCLCLQRIMSNTPDRYLKTCLKTQGGTNKVHLGYEVVSAIVYSYECFFARSSVIFHRKGSDDDRTTPAE